jgi:hypothetical protein
MPVEVINHSPTNKVTGGKNCYGRPIVFIRFDNNGDSVVLGIPDDYNTEDVTINRKAFRELCEDYLKRERQLDAEKKKR